MARRKKGKNARRSRQGLLGLTSTTTIAKKQRPKEFAKRDAIRHERKDEKNFMDKLKEAAVGGKDVKIRDKDSQKMPHSFVVHMGKVGRYVRRLEHDLRELMSPNTSKNLKVMKRNNLKDFIVNGQTLGVTHLILLSRSLLSVNLRIICCPQGPTLQFKVEKYALSRDILAMQKRPLIHEGLFKREPLVVLNGFSGDQNKRHLLLAQASIQNMFPSIDIDSVNLSDIKRVLLANYNQETDTIELRHYSVKHVPCGVSKSTKKLLQSKVPDLSKYEDISDFLLNPGMLSDSEFEGEQVELSLPQDIKQRGQLKGQKTKIRLLEIGPRLTLKLVKIEEGVDGGEVLYHSLVHKTTKEIDALRRAAPLIKKKRERQEKNIQHAVIRKLKANAERTQLLQSNQEKLKSTLIQKQKQASGELMINGAEDYSSDDYRDDEDDEEEGTKTKPRGSASKRFK